MMAAKLAGVPHRLHTIAGLPLLEAKGLKRILLNQVEKITYACATKIYPNSFGLKDIILEEKFTNTNKIKVIGNGSSNGIDTSFFDSDLISSQEKNALKQHLGLTNKDFVFVFIGRLVTDKGINELIKAFVEINKRHPHTKLLLVGGYETVLDPISTYSMETIKTHKNIVSVGWQDDVRPYFAISHALVFPSYREGFPNVVLQAGAMKLPCIVSNINGCNEIISDNVNGFIIPVKNTESLINHMERLYAMNPEDLYIMGEKSREMIISKFERKFVWDCLLNEYQQIENKLEPNFKTTI
jgi:glycosyltransferase involved in cell wall biosynthesis